MAERRIRVGVIGAGTFAEQCHVPGVQAHPRAEVVALCALSMPLTRGQREHLHLLRSGSSSWEPLPLPPDALTETPHALTRMMGAFVDAILRGQLDPDRDPDFTAGLHTQLALDAGLRSARNGTWERVHATV
jgi:predicted dehydrogenase